MKITFIVILYVTSIISTSPVEGSQAKQDAQVELDSDFLLAKPQPIETVFREVVKKGAKTDTIYIQSAGETGDWSKPVSIIVAIFAVVSSWLTFWSNRKLNLGIQEDKKVHDWEIHRKKRKDALLDKYTELVSDHLSGYQDWVKKVWGEVRAFGYNNWWEQAISLPSTADVLKDKEYNRVAELVFKDERNDTWYHKMADLGLFFYKAFPCMEALYKRHEVITDAFHTFLMAVKERDKGKAEDAIQVLVGLKKHIYDQGLLVGLFMSEVQIHAWEEIEPVERPTERAFFPRVDLDKDKNIILVEENDSGENHETGA